MDDERIGKTYIDAREFFMTLAELQFESGYPYMVFEDTVNRANPIDGRIAMSNLCSEILQVQEPSTYHEDLSYDHVGRDVSCNLGSLNIAKAMDGDLGRTVERAIRALTSVSEHTDIACVPSIRRANDEGHAIGLGQMNLHGFLARESIMYGSPEALDFTDMYFMTVAYHAYRASHDLAVERGTRFRGFERSAYAKPAGAGNYFDKYTNGERPLAPKTGKKSRRCSHNVASISPTRMIGGVCVTTSCVTVSSTNIYRPCRPRGQFRTSIIPRVPSILSPRRLRFARKARLDGSTIRLLI